MPYVSGEIGDRRSGSLRVSVNLWVVGRVPATPIVANLVDLSETGCRIHSHDGHLIAPGATILLNISTSSEVAGQIVWQRGEQFGVRFRVPISEELVQQLVLDSSHRDASGLGVLDSFGRPLPSPVSLKR